MNELISIIVPVYKVEEYLNKCIDSILIQTYQNIEVILVDDGSPDKCGEVCDEYAKKDWRVKVVHKKNGGLSDARNVGIEKSTGKYISFIDSDDWVHCEYINELYQLIKSKDADIAVCNFLKTSTENIDITLEDGIIYEYSNIDALRQYGDKFGVQMVVAWGKLYKRQLFMGIRFTFGRVHEDEFTTYKLIFKARKIVFTTRQLLYYRQHSDSIIGSAFKLQNGLDAIDALFERAEFFESLGLAELNVMNNKILFLLFLPIFRYLRQNRSDIIDNDYYQRFFDLRAKLRSGKYELKFKIFYEAYYIAPATIEKLYEYYKILKNK